MALTWVFFLAISKSFLLLLGALKCPSPHLFLFLLSGLSFLSQTTTITCNRITTWLLANHLVYSRFHIRKGLLEPYKHIMFKINQNHIFSSVSIPRVARSRADGLRKLKALLLRKACLKQRNSGSRAGGQTPKRLVGFAMVLCTYYSNCQYGDTLH